MAKNKTAFDVASNMYGIHEGYNWNRNPMPYYAPEHPNDYQTPVYIMAKKLLIEHEYKSVLDFGCGSGYKLIKYFSNVFTIGIDLPRTVEYLRRVYPLRAWYYQDCAGLLAVYGDVIDLVICCDVIEHLINPNILMLWLQSVNAKRYVISTPERDLMGENTFDGPPRNPCHAREWNGGEFQAYVSQFFHVEKFSIVEKATQVIEMVSL